MMPDSNSFAERAAELDEVAEKNSAVKIQGCHPRHFERILSSGNWFIFPRDFLQIMSIEESVLLSHLINFSSMVKASLKDGWFYCTVDRLEQDLSMSVRTQARILRSLSSPRDGSRAIVELQRKGLPAKRFVRINFDVLETALALADYKASKQVVDEPSCLVRTEPKQLEASELSRLYKNKHIKERNTPPSAAQSGGASRFASRANEMLYDKLEKEEKVTNGHSPRSSGPKYFDILLKKLGGNKKRIKRVLLGYIKHFGNRYMPLAYSARKFCDTSERTDKIFFRIERAIDRIEGREKAEKEEVIS